MKEIQHGNTLELGIAELDAQHQGLLSLVQRLRQHVRYGELSTAHALFDELIESKRAHCQYEESLLKSVGYPFHRTHSKTHQQFLLECGLLRQRILRGDFLRQPDADALHQWIVDHIRGDDGDYATYVKTQAAPQDEVPWHLRTLNRLFPGRSR